MVDLHNVAIPQVKIKRTENPDLQDHTPTIVSASTQLLA
jgi:hypothetical protein